MMATDQVGMVLGQASFHPELFVRVILLAGSASFRLALESLVVHRGPIQHHLAGGSDSGCILGLHEKCRY